MNTNRDIVDPLNSVKTVFKQDVVREVLTSGMPDKARITSEAVSLVCEVAKCLAAEAAARASAQALRDSTTEVDIQHVEKCLPQLLLDFP